MSVTTALDGLYGLGYKNSDNEDARYDAVTLEQSKSGGSKISATGGGGDRDHQAAESRSRISASVEIAAVRGSKLILPGTNFAGETNNVDPRITVE